MEVTDTKKSEPNRKLERAWSMYDWANSVFPLSITTAIFPVYYEGVTRKASIAAGMATETDYYIDFLGHRFLNTALYSYSLSFAFYSLPLCNRYSQGLQM